MGIFDSFNKEGPEERTEQIHHETTSGHQEQATSGKWHIGGKEYRFIKRLAPNAYLAKSADGEMIAIKKSGLPGPDGIPTYDDPTDEIRIHSGLNHPNIVKFIAGWGNRRTALFIATQYLDGETVARRFFLRGGAQDEVLPLLLQITDAVAYLHGVGVIHRDITPENIIVSDNKAFLIDFGYAADFSSDNLALFVPMTVVFSGTLWSRTIWIRPPEKEMGPWSDVFSLGAAATYMLTGKPILLSRFSGQYSHELGVESIHRFLPEVNPTVSEEFGEVLGKSMSLKPEFRFYDAREMLKALKQVRNHRQE